MNESTLITFGALMLLATIVPMLLLLASRYLHRRQTINAKLERMRSEAEERQGHRAARQSMRQVGLAHCIEAEKAQRERLLMLVEMVVPLIDPIVRFFMRETASEANADESEVGDEEAARDDGEAVRPGADRAWPGRDSTQPQA